MRDTPTTQSNCKSTKIGPFQIAHAAQATLVQAELAAEHRREFRRLDDIAYSLLRGADGDRIEAENSLEDIIQMLFEGGALAIWKYRIVLAKIREGL